MKKLFFLLIIFVCFTTITLNAQQTDELSNSTMDTKSATYYNSAIQYMKAEQYESALKLIDSSLIIAKDYRIYYLQGQANLKLGKTNDAIVSFNESLKLNPEYDLGWMAAGNTHLALMEYDQALNDFKKAAETTKNADTKNNVVESINFVLNAKSIEFYNDGNELNKQGKFEEAIKSYDEALNISKDPKYFYQKGVVYTKLKKYKEAEIELKSAIALDDSFDLGYVALGNVQTVNKDYEQAVKSYEKALSVTKNETLKLSIQESISKTYFSAGSNSYSNKKYDQSIDWMLKSNAITPSDLAYLGLAKAYIEKKKYSDANTALDSAKALQKTISDGAISYYRGMIHLNKGEDAKAIEMFTVALVDANYKKASQSQIDYLKKKQKGAK